MYILYLSEYCKGCQCQKIIDLVDSLDSNARSIFKYELIEPTTRRSTLPTDLKIIPSLYESRGESRGSETGVKRREGIQAIIKLLQAMTSEMRTKQGPALDPRPGSSKGGDSDLGGFSDHDGGNNFKAKLDLNETRDSFLLKTNPDEARRNMDKIWGTTINLPEDKRQSLDRELKPGAGKMNDKFSSYAMDGVQTDMRNREPTDMPDFLKPMVVKGSGSGKMKDIDIDTRLQMLRAERESDPEIGHPPERI